MNALGELGVLALSVAGFRLVAGKVAVFVAIGVLVTLIGDLLVRFLFRLADRTGGDEDPDGDGDPVETDPAGADRVVGDRVVGDRVETVSAEEAEAGSRVDPPGDAGTGQQPFASVPAVDPEEPRTVAAGDTLRGGQVIGWLERIATYATLLAGFPEGIAAIVAIKGLARYPDLHAEDGTAERFIVGTFTSLLVASAGAGLTRWITGLW